MATTNESKMLDMVKIWLFPSLISVLGWFLITSVNEMKSDIKKLLAQASADQVQIEYLQKEVDALNHKTFSMTNPNPPNEIPNYIHSDLAFLHQEDDKNKYKNSKKVTL
jgi:cell division protein FtsB